MAGIDRHHPPHTFGSTHGETRITRQAIGEGSSYVPLALRSHAIWKQVEQETGSKLLHEVGALTLSKRDEQPDTPRRTEFLNQCISAANHYGITHEILSPEEVTERYPHVTPGANEVGFYEPKGGYLSVEACVEANLQMAERHGAVVRLGTEVIRFEPGKNGVQVTTDEGNISADKLVVSAGAWAGLLLGAPFSEILKPTRQVMHWFELERSLINDWRESPVYMWIHDSGPKGFFYGFPSRDGLTMKCADEGGGDRADPDRIDRHVAPEESAEMFRHHLAGRMTGVSDRPAQTATCIYTETRDGDFLIDWHPDWDNVLVVSPCSGHGFKHSAAIGEAVAQHVMEGRSDVDISPFGLQRLLD